MKNYLGIDIGTSGTRVILIDEDSRIRARAETAFPSSSRQQNMVVQQPQDWWQGVLDCLQQIHTEHGLSGVEAIAIDGTSGTTLLTDASNTPLCPALMYNDVRPASSIEQVLQLAPGVPACSRSSALAKTIWLTRNFIPSQPCLVQQQADWVMSCFSGRPGVSDWNNSLKLGFDVDHLCWPEWLGKVLSSHRDEVVIATKFGTIPGKGKDFSVGHMRRSLEESLRRLRTDYIDIYQLHSPAPEVLHDEELLAALEAVKKEGKIRCYGLSTEGGQRGIDAIDKWGVDSVQITFNLFHQDPAERFFPEAERKGVGVIVKSPLDDP